MPVPDRLKGRYARRKRSLSEGPSRASPPQRSRQFLDGVRRSSDWQATPSNRSNLPVARARYQTRTLRVLTLNGVAVYCSSLRQLCLRERGQERILASTEWPGDIVWRRLERAGSDESDGIELLSGAGLGFILKFVYKSLFLGPAEEELKFDNFEYIDLSGRSLRTIPVVRPQHVDAIVSLRLSCNPMIEIPLDFVQSCTTLRELRLSHLALKKVSHSLRHSSTLTRLDLSCNRFVTLGEAYLDDFPGLTSLYVQNNRLEKLPCSFPCMRRLITLHLSNNKFRTFPVGVSELGNLRNFDRLDGVRWASLGRSPLGLTSLDVSNAKLSLIDEYTLSQQTALRKLKLDSNSIRTIPDSLVELKRLETLSCPGNSLVELPASLGQLRKLQNLDVHEPPERCLGRCGVYHGPQDWSFLGTLSWSVSIYKLPSNG
ncbi:hypothetical protein C8F01DRAFT_1258824 [Mycena amicta]|nr:hypothetical protein C8F01DRAFT_1258824 [Mycena amicta]